MVADCEHAYRDMRAQFGARLQRNEPMSRHTSYGIGGPADLYVEARAPEELVELADCARAHSLAVLWLGSGTNVLVADAGVRGLVVTNSCQGMTVSDEGLVVAQSGTLLRELAQWAVRLGWAGLEWAVGIPGTVGGAVVGNAGAYGGCMADAVAWATVLEDGAQRQLTAAELGYSYRTSALKRESQPRRRMVLAAALQLRRGDPAELAQVAERNNAQRVARTPQGPSAGSVFKRTLQYPAGFLVEQAGLKGQRLGGAEISAQHANYILNLGGASAADVRALIELAQERVWANFALRLEPEIEFVGEWS
jgi:UDP-N-acetylmuramate dehydrogenase